MTRLPSLRQARSASLRQRTAGRVRNWPVRNSISKFFQKRRRTSRRGRGEVRMDRRSPRPVQRHPAMPDSGRFAQRILPVACSSSKRVEGASERGPGCESRSSIHRKHRGTYGRPCIGRQLRVQGRSVSAECVRCSLQRQGLRPVYRRSWSITTDSAHSPPWRRTGSVVVSTAGSLIAPGSATSRLSGPAKAGCISQRFSIWRTGAWWASPCPNASMPSWFSRHCAARAGNVNRHRDCYYSPTEGRNMQAGHTGSWPRDSRQRSPGVVTYGGIL